jgi:hypothetical protein
MGSVGGGSQSPRSIAAKLLPHLGLAHPDRHGAPYAPFTTGYLGCGISEPKDLPSILAILEAAERARSGTAHALWIAKGQVTHWLSGQGTAGARQTAARCARAATHKGSDEEKGDEKGPHERERYSPVDG